MPIPDSVEHEVTISTPVERVWELVAEAGWWIGDGNRSAQSRHQEDGLTIIEDPKYGRYPVKTETTEAPRRVSYRWSAGFPGENPGQGNSTLVEFELTPQHGGTRVRVVESGFGSLAVSEDEREKAVNGNIEGWHQQLDILKDVAEKPSA